MILKAQQPEEEFPALPGVLELWGCRRELVAVFCRTIKTYTQKYKARDVEQ